MSRLIDRLPAPRQMREKKVIVLSRSRVGTFSMYQALEMLGYKGYHMAEVVGGGVTHMALFEEALKCKYLGGGKPYGKTEFDKWLAEYDVLGTPPILRGPLGLGISYNISDIQAIVEIPQFFPEEFIEFYPSARFILTERNIESWVKSMNNTAVPMFTSMRGFSMSAIGKIDPFIEGFRSLHVTLERVVYHGKTCQSEKGIELSKRDTLELSEKAKALAPEGRLLVARLEDGFGWEQICPFLGHPIPETRYPRGNAPQEFQKMADEILVPRIRNASLKVLSAVLIPKYLRL